MNLTRIHDRSPMIEDRKGLAQFAIFNGALQLTDGMAWPQANHALNRLARRLWGEGDRHSVLDIVALDRRSIPLARINLAAQDCVPADLIGGAH